MKNKIKVFVSADKSHVIVADWRERNGKIVRYRKEESDENMSKEQFEFQLSKLERDGFYIQLERE